MQESDLYDGADESAPSTNRMIIAVTGLIGLFISIYTLMFKLGMLGMACGSGACEIVQLSPFATQLGIPVPVWGVAGYGAMMITAMMGLQERFARARMIAVILLLGATFALIFTGYLSYLESQKIHAWCRWCLGSAANVCVMFMAALPELRRLRQQDA